MDTQQLPAPPAPQQTKTRRWPWILGMVAALLVGVGIGASGSEIDGAGPDGPPAVETVTIERTPESCIEALDLASKGFTLAGVGMGNAADALKAAARFDLDGLRVSAERMNAITGELNRLKTAVQEASQDCRSKA
jgi:hypothetical protein